MNAVQTHVWRFAKLLTNDGVFLVFASAMVALILMKGSLHKMVREA